MNVQVTSVYHLLISRTHTHTHTLYPPCLRHNGTYSLTKICVDLLWCALRFAFSPRSEIFWLPKIISQPPCPVRILTNGCKKQEAFGAVPVLSMTRWLHGNDGWGLMFCDDKSLSHSPVEFLSVCVCVCVFIQVSPPSVSLWRIYFFISALKREGFLASSSSHFLVWFGFCSSSSAHPQNRRQPSSANSDKPTVHEPTCLAPTGRPN